MQPMDELMQMANQINSLEKQTTEITHDWYQFAPADEEQFQRISELTGQTQQVLEQLSTKLDARLRRQDESPGNRQRLQYAYNVVQELLQSRQATAELTASILDEPDTAYQEYLRALALKEKAAASQVSKLVDTLEQIYAG